MKKLLSLTLAALMLSAALASCAVSRTAGAISANIRLTSSDAADAAAWLADRLGERLTDRVVLGTDADGYGVDVSALEDDGYFIRSFGREDVLFAKTADGLDRAVRKYAKTVEAGEPIADVTYHEGYRVKLLTVAGADISTFAVRVEGRGREDDVTRLRDRVEQYVAPAVGELINAMCGATLASPENALHFIVFRPTAESGWGEGTYRYAVEDGDLVFEYAELLGAKYAFLTFLSDECGWAGVSGGFDDLAESDGIDVPADLDVTVEPMVEGLRTHLFTYGQQRHSSAYQKSEAFRRLQPVSYRIPHACNGWLTYRWGGYDVANTTPCMTDPNVIDSVTNSILDYIEDRVDAGAVIGYDLTAIDVAHGDNGSFCQCKNCKKVYGEEKSVAGASVRFSNAIWEGLDEEGYGLLKVIFYAYMGNREPCRTRPLDNVLVTYCTDFHCVTHPLDGSKCVETTHLWEDIGFDYHLRCIEGWKALTDELYIWHYDLCYNLHPYICVDQIWDDFHMFREAGATRIYWTTEYYGFSIVEIEEQLIEWLDHHPDASKIDYRDKYFALLAQYYGDGWAKIAEAYELWERAELESDRCACGWYFTSKLDTEQMNYAYYVGNCWEPILALFDEAIAVANSAWNVKNIEIMKACHLYHGCLGSYFPAYETYDDEKMALIETRYSEALALLRRNGLDPNAIGTVGGTISFPDDIHELAWSDWNERIMYPDGTRQSGRINLLTQFGLYAEGTALREAPELGE